MTLKYPCVCVCVCDRCNDNYDENMKEKSSNCDVIMHTELFWLNFDQLQWPMPSLRPKHQIKPWEVQERYMPEYFYDFL